MSRFRHPAGANRQIVGHSTLCNADSMGRTIKRFGHGSGSIVTIASVAGLRGSAAIDPSYRCFPPSPCCMLVGRSAGCAEVTVQLCKLD
jgi:hypothetical protein